MHFIFNERKTAQMAARFAQLAGGQINYLLLMKLMYMADRMALVKKGRPISGDSFVAMKFGPVLSKVLDLLRDQPRCADSPWFEYIAPQSEYRVSLKKNDPETDELSRHEMKVIDEVFKTYGDFDPFHLADLTHEICPEWQNPGDASFPIRPEDILEHEGVPEREIQRIAEDVSALQMVEFLKGIPV